MTLLEQLLSQDGPALRTKTVRLKRTGAEVKLKGISFDRLMELREMDSRDTPVHIVLAGMAEPVFKDKDAMDRHHAVTPAELVKNALLPGEIIDLQAEIEKLSGFRGKTLEEIKKK